MKKIIITSLFLISSLTVHAQSETPNWVSTPLAAWEGETYIDLNSIKPNGENSAYRNFRTYANNSNAAGGAEYYGKSAVVYFTVDCNELDSIRSNRVILYEKFDLKGEIADETVTGHWVNLTPTNAIYINETICK